MEEADSGQAVVVSFDWATVGENHEEVRLRLIHCDAPESLECLLVDPGTEVRAAASVDWLANLYPFLVRKCY